MLWPFGLVQDGMWTLQEVETSDGQKGFVIISDSGGGRVNETHSFCFPWKPCLVSWRQVLHIHATSEMPQARLVSPSSLALLAVWSLPNL